MFTYNTCIMSSSYVGNCMYNIIIIVQASGSIYEVKDETLFSTSYFNSCFVDFEVSF